MGSPLSPRLCILLASLVFCVPALADVVANECFNHFKKTLVDATHTPPSTAGLEYQQNRFERIFGDLYQLDIDSVEKMELTKTLEFLELANNKKKIFSSFEIQFHRVYTIFNKKKINTNELHHYFRALVREDLLEAQRAAGAILQNYPDEVKALLMKHGGIHPSDDHFWRTYERPRETHFSLINYSDRQNEALKGVKIEPDLRSLKKDSKLEQMAQAMEDIHNVHVASVPQAIEKLRSNGFSTREATFTNLEVKNSPPVTGPMIIIPNSNVEYGVISSTTKHEARHAFYATKRAQKASSAYDIAVQEYKGKPLRKNEPGMPMGYLEYQSYEEISTHSKDLMDSFRAGNREILETFKTTRTIPSNAIIDLSYLNSKAKNIQMLADQTHDTAVRALKEVDRMKNTSVGKLAYFQCIPSQEGYQFAILVDDSFILTTVLSSDAERTAAKNLVDVLFPINEQRALAEAAHQAFDPSRFDVTQPQLNEVLSHISDKINRANEVALKLKKEIVPITDLINRFDVQLPSLTREEYLKVRDLLAKPASEVTGKVLNNPEQAQKALDLIRKKRQDRKISLKN